MSKILVITPASAPVITLDDAKAQCRATDFSDDDPLLQRLAAAATQTIDGPGAWLGRSLNPQTLELRQRLFTASGHFDHEWSPADRIRWGRENPWSACIPLRFGPVQEIVSVSYVDLTGANQTLDSSTYELVGDPATNIYDIRPAYGQRWPENRPDVDGVRIRYVAGYPLTTDPVPLPTVPEPVRHALLLLVSHWYRNRDAVVGVDNRDSSTELPLGVESLLGPFQVVG
jgi:uncharacterized phiE125 gp8 family phage protein